MTCPHTTITGFCFPCYQTERATQFAALHVALERALFAGLVVVETWPGGRETAWRYDAASARTLAITLTDDASVEHDAFIAGLPAAYLADHLVNRSRGFGTTTTIQGS